MQKKYWLIAGTIAALGAAGAGWILERQSVPPSQSSAIHLRHTAILALPETTVAVPQPGGNSTFLVLGLSAKVTTLHALPKTWMAKHDAQIRAEILSTLLNMKDLGDVEKSSALRTQVRMFVAKKISHAISTNPRLVKVHVYITKLILQ
ncbi:flagellar basal body-associated FliL family protein [Acidithiobacillus caldus]|uniref:Flagellar protein FliL n=1 Tax=Acidithiobacillus caldus TaxID=33059 RepID=A0A1E7YPF1_9PROT|nr:flagellar basal body-associated FliL family protein [Acidithiobacillus caldus]OFC35768.1 hypothetical protein BAE28_10105 [Acidithiobacillus caldus]OFC35895.1 hypothetical protein BAE29_14190 [Acidithiobacillus caldus]OFC37594.1 hypothetical protein BAE27_03900 [Acidithiobacillus caldus]